MFIKNHIFFTFLLIIIFLFSLTFGFLLRFFIESNNIITNYQQKNVVLSSNQKTNLLNQEKNNYQYFSFQFKNENFNDFEINDKNYQNENEDLFLLKKSLIEKNEDFIEIYLDKMELNIYEKGQFKKTFKVLTKGREGSWWETPSGFYKILSKEINKFSNIGKVWMPYSMQFFGNFFIHGWPYYPDGTPVASNYSGGCIRLSTQDAKEIFNFVKKDLPILIFDKKDENQITSLINQETEFLKKINLSKFDSLPFVSASSALVLNLDTGLIYLNKNGEKNYSIASLTKLMSALVATEVIYLEKQIKIDFESNVLKLGKSYTIFELFYPLLMQSSNETANKIANFIGFKEFISYMNNKAKSLNMENTSFADPSGISAENISTAFDLAKLAKYILEKRKFIFDITLGKKYDYFGEIYLNNIKNFNEFVEYKNLIGVKNGYTQTAKETLLTVWQLENKNLNFKSNFLIVVLGSDNRKKDAEQILNWLKNNFGLE